MKRLIYYLISLGLAAASSGCIYEYNSDISQNPPAEIAISGDIVIGGVSTFCVSNVLPISADKSLDKYPSAKVFVECEDGSSLQAKGGKNGEYSADCSRLDPSKRYRVRVESDKGKTYSSQWAQVIQDPVIDLVSHSYDDEKVYITADISSPDGSAGYYRIDYEEVWEYHADFVPEYMYNIEEIKQSKIISEEPGKIYRKPREDEDFYNCWSRNVSKEYILCSSEGLSGGKIKEKLITTFRRSESRCMVLYCINLRVLSIDKNAYAYLENIQKTSNTTGDLFTPVPSEMRGNVFNDSDQSELVYGYVTTSRMVSQRYFIQTSRIYRLLYNPESKLYFPELKEKTGDYGFYDLYMQGERPVKINDPTAVFTPSPSKTNILWGPGRCTDCRFDGGTKNKPDYWPNNDK